MVQKTKPFRDSGDSIRARMTPEVPNGPVGFPHSSFQDTKDPLILKNQRAMDKFRQLVFKIAEISNPAEKDVIEKHLTDYASNSHTPNHPPYAAMIEKAITELNEKSGSSEESISNYIKMEFKDLPWAHSTILKDQLCKLCEFDEISMTKGRYVIGIPKPKREDIKRKYKPKSKSMRGRGRCKKETNYVEQLHDERVVMTENKNEEKNPTLKTPDMAIGEENEVILNINEQENFAININSLPVTIEKLEQIENLQESDTRFTAACKVNLDLLEKEEDGNPRSCEIDSERTDIENKGMAEEQNLAPELLHAAIEKEYEDVELEYEPENRLNHNSLQSESRLTTSCTLYPILDSGKEEDDKHLNLEAELNPNSSGDRRLEIDCERTDFVKVGLAEEQNIAPELLKVAIVKENEDVELKSESENRLNQNLPQSNSNLTTAGTLFLNLDSHEKEEEEKYQNSETESNPKPEDSEKMEVDSDRADLVKVGLAEEQNHAPPILTVAMEEENEDVQGESESENGLNHNLPQSKSSLETEYPLCVNLGLHEKEDKKLLNSEAELNPKPEDDKKQENGGKITEKNGVKQDLTLNSEHIDEEVESNISEKDGKTPEKDDEKSDLTLSSEHIDEDDESTLFTKDGEKTEKYGETTEKDGEKTYVTVSSEHIDEEDEGNMLDNTTDRQQRQLKRWRQSQQKGQLEQIPMNNDILDEEKCQQQKEEPGFSQQPKRQLRSQSQSQPSGKVVNHVELSSAPEKSTVLKRAKINTESQTRRLTRSAAAKIAENEISNQIPLQKPKLRSWHKQNTESSSAPADRQNSSSRSRLMR